MASPISRIRGFYDETVQEIKKCTWPTSKELIESTALVMITLMLFSLFVWVVDLVSQYLIRLFILS